MCIQGILKCERVNTTAVQCNLPLEHRTGLRKAVFKRQVPFSYYMYAALIPSAFLLLLLFVTIGIYSIDVCTTPLVSVSLRCHIDDKKPAGSLRSNPIIYTNIYYQPSTCGVRYPVPRVHTQSLPNIFHRNKQSSCACKSVNGCSHAIAERLEGCTTYVDEHQTV